MKFCSSVLELHLPQNICHTHTHRHFPEIVKSCSEHPEMCKSIKNRKLKNCTKPILSPFYIEESYKNFRESPMGEKMCSPLSAFYYVEKVIFISSLSQNLETNK